MVINQLVFIGLCLYLLVEDRLLNSLLSHAAIQVTSPRFIANLTVPATLFTPQLLHQVSTMCALIYNRSGNHRQ